MLVYDSGAEKNMGENKNMFDFRWQWPLVTLCLGMTLAGCGSIPLLSQATLFDGELRISPPPGYCKIEGPVSQSDTHAMVAYTPCFKKGTEIITVTATALRDAVDVAPTQLGTSASGRIARAAHSGPPRPFEEAAYVYRVWSQSAGYGVITTYYGPDDTAKRARSTLMAFHRNLQNTAPNAPQNATQNATVAQ